MRREAKVRALHPRTGARRPLGVRSPREAGKVVGLAGMRFRRHELPVGDEKIPVLVSSEDGVPKAVFMSYEAFLEIAATLYTAVEALKVAGVDPDELFGPDAEEAELIDLFSQGSDAESVLRQVPPPVEADVDEPES